MMILSTVVPEPGLRQEKEENKRCNRTKTTDSLLGVYVQEPVEALNLVHEIAPMSAIATISRPGASGKNSVARQHCLAFLAPLAYLQGYHLDSTV